MKEESSAAKTNTDKQKSGDKQLVHQDSLDALDDFF